MMTITEKILARASGKSRVSPNEYVTARIDLAMMPGNLQTMRKVLARNGVDEDLLKVWDPERFVLVLDHNVSPTTVSYAEHDKETRLGAKKFGIKHFYDVFPGIGHQIVHEKGHVLPGQLIVGSDSHTTTYGALNVAATGIGVSEMAYVMATGELWFRVPETIRVEVRGKLQKGVSAKDIILLIAGMHGTDFAQYKSIEWTGSAIEAMSLDSRLTMANMSVELGAKFGLFRSDEKTLEYLRRRTDRELETVESDPGAEYAAELCLDAATIEPQAALPHSVGNVKKLSEMEDIPIDQAVIASCCHGRIEDLETAAIMLKGRRVHPGVRFYVAPASWEVYHKAIELGIITTLVEAGVMIENPSCGLCTGFHGVLASGERCIAALPRNFKGRMGSAQAEIYLASPAAVTASAIAGRITDPREVL